MMMNKIDFPKRKNMRLHDVDYSAPGAYFITICTQEKQKMLSHIVGAIHESPAMNVKLSEYGEFVERYIQIARERFDIEINQYVIMSNHVHLIIEIVPNGARAIRESTLRSRSIIS